MCRSNSNRFLDDGDVRPVGSQGDGRDIAAREILKRGAGRIRKKLANEPLLEARLPATIGYVYTGLVLCSEARPTLDEAVALARGPGDRGQLNLAQALIRRGTERYLDEPGKAESDDREALAVLERTYGPNHINVEPALTELGLLLRTRDPEQALRLYRRSYDLLVAAHGGADGYAAVLLQNIGSIHTRARRFQDGEDVYERALPLLRRRFGERDPRVGSVLGNLALVYRSLGTMSRLSRLRSAVSRSTCLFPARLALEQIDRAIEIFGQGFPSEHPYRIPAANFRAGFSDRARTALRGAKDAR